MNILHIRSQDRRVIGQNRVPFFYRDDILEIIRADKRKPGLSRYRAHKPTGDCSLFPLVFNPTAIVNSGGSVQVQKSLQCAVGRGTHPFPL